MCPGLSKGTVHALSGVQTGDSMPVTHVHWKGLSPRPHRQLEPAIIAYPTEAVAVSHGHWAPRGREYSRLHRLPWFMAFSVTVGFQFANTWLRFVGSIVNKMTSL